MTPNLINNELNDKNIFVMVPASELWSSYQLAHPEGLLWEGAEYGTVEITGLDQLEITARVLRCTSVGSTSAVWRAGYRLAGAL